MCSVCVECAHVYTIIDNILGILLAIDEVVGRLLLLYHIRSDGGFSVWTGFYFFFVLSISRQPKQYTFWPYDSCPRSLIVRWVNWLSPAIRWLYVSRSTSLRIRIIVIDTNARATTIARISCRVVIKPIRFGLTSLFRKQDDFTFQTMTRFWFRNFKMGLPPRTRSYSNVLYRPVFLLLFLNACLTRSSCHHQVA